MPFELTRKELPALEADGYILDGGTQLSVRRRGLFRRELEIVPAVAGTDAEALTGAYLSGLEEAAGRRCGAVAMGLLGLSAGAAAEVTAAVLSRR